MLDRFRASFPPSGRRYELFDTSLYLLWIGLIGYVLFPTPNTVAAGLPAPLHVVSEADLGIFVVATSAFGAWAAHWGSERQLDLGYALPRIAAMFMAANFLVGVATLVVDCTGLAHVVPAGVDPTQALRASLLYVVIFGWAARRLKRDNRAEWER